VTVHDTPLTMLGSTGYGWAPVQVTERMLALRVDTRLEGQLARLPAGSGCADVRASL
jgi:hypothetical protein